MDKLIYALLAIPMILIISTAIFNNFAANIDRSNWATAANTSYTTVTTQTWSGYNLAALLPFIYIALIIVAAVLGAFGYVGMKNG